MLKIGEFSKIAKTTIKTLRYYDDIELFKPSFVDENGYRYYELSKLKELLKIIELRSIDLPIESIKLIVNGGNESEILSDHIKNLKAKKELLASQISNTNRILKGESMNMDFKVEYKTIEENIVYYRHGVIPKIDDITMFVLDSGTRCSKLNPDLKCKDYCYITYSSEEYKDKDIELEYVEAVESFGEEGNEIKFRKDPKIKALVVTVKGSYSNLSKGYNFALNEVKENGFNIIGPIREVYINGCWNTDSEENYLTEIQVPIE